MMRFQEIKTLVGKAPVFLASCACRLSAVGTSGQKNETKALSEFLLEQKTE